MLQLSLEAAAASFADALRVSLTVAALNFGRPSGQIAVQAT